MAKGRKQISNELKTLRGTDQPVRMKDEILVEKLVNVSPPKYIKTRRAKKIFKDKSNQLIHLKLLTAIDVELLAIYCNSLDMVLIAIDELADGELVEQHTDMKTGAVKYTTNPYLKIYKEMVEMVNKIGSEFGFSPISRQRLAATKTDKKKDDIDDFIFGKSK